jgi:hypothetical protein
MRLQITCASPGLIRMSSINIGKVTFGGLLILPTYVSIAVFLSMTLWSTLLKVVASISTIIVVTYLFYVLAKYLFINGFSLAKIRLMIFVLQMSPFVFLAITKVM